MFYAFDYTVTTSDVASSKYKLNLPVVTGIIHQVDILFQSGCDHKINVQIFDGASQIWPSNRGSSFRGNATVISFREFYPMKSDPAELVAYIWTTDTGTLYEVIIEIGILPKKIIEPLTVDDLIEVLGEL